MVPPASPSNAFSIDVEDYFQVSAFERCVQRSAWDRWPRRVEHNVDRLLDLLARHRVHATFFTLGWIAVRHPAMVRRIHAAGHEVASHGYGHQRVVHMTPAEFTGDAAHAKQTLEDLVGAPIIGYRAPSFSLGSDTPWAFETLRTLGYRYSSSVYPVRHDLYGSPDAPRFAHRTSSGLVEIPPSTVRLSGRNFPASGGGFFRLLPYRLSRWSLRRVNQVDRQPAVFYCHPWEIDPGQPRVPGADARSRFRHYLNLERTYGRLDRLLADLRWDRIDRVFAGHLDGTGP